ncbi:TraB/GumN family protein [Cryomorphaceae bacterium 1068]|nr:TraB/GumN family protein [Cryomorphaceae bacterium 1068]
MRKTSIAILLVFAFTYMIGQEGNNTPRDKTILFKIFGQDSTMTSYLFGTHHAFGKAFFDTLTSANQALESCDLLILESAIISGRTAEDIINQRTAKTEWKQYLSKKDLAFIKNLFSTSPTDFNKITPTEMYVFLQRHFKQKVCLNKSSSDTSLSLDGYISSRAKEENIQVRGLETTEEQIVFINKDVEGMPRKRHRKRLAAIIDKICSENSKYCEETDWYSTMEIDYKFDEPCRNSLMLTDRNNKWVGSITEMLESSSCFIAVGLSHLKYECGLINQLEELGYTVTPIDLK